MINLCLETMRRIFKNTIVKSKHIFVLLVICFQACNLHTPENYFGRTTLNTNRYHNLGARDFAEMKSSKKANMLYGSFDEGEFKTTDSYETHIRGMKMTFLDEDIKKIKELKVTSETEDLIKTSLEVFELVQSIYENDYIKIAKLMDDKASSEDLDAAMKKLERSVNQYYVKREALLGIAIPYAKQNKIDVRF